MNHLEKATPSSRTAHDSHMNYRYLNIPEKVQRLHEMRSLQHRTQVQLNRLRAQLQKIIEEEGVEVTEAMHSDLKQIVNDHDCMVP